MSQKDSEERKQLEKRITALKAERESKREVYYRARSDFDDCDAEVVKLQNRLEALKPKAIKVSDHAVLRYLERKAGLDIEAIRKSILESELPSMVAALGGSGKFPINGYQVVLKDFTVVTIN